MPKRSATQLTEAFERALQDQTDQKYMLRLYVVGNTARSAQAIHNLKAICEEKLHGRYQLEVIDINQQPGSARQEQVIVTPTLIKTLPLPMRRIIGDLSQKDRVLIGLGLDVTDDDAGNEP